MSLSERRPTFNVPMAISPIDGRSLQESKLLELYDLNKQDFFAAAGLVYDTAIRYPDPSAITDPHQGFGSFCELLTQYFLAAPTERIICSRDEKGRYVNFFGEALLDHLNSKLSMQDLYGPDGSEKHGRVWAAVSAFVRYLTIEAIRQDSFPQDVDIAAARERISELSAGRRALQRVPSVPRRLFY